MIWEENKVKLSEITIDNELIFDSHILNILSKANKKLSVLCKLKNISATKEILFQSFFEAQFKYCLLIWMFCTISTNSKINKLYERALRIPYDIYNSKFEELLSKDGSFTIST